MCGIAGIVRLDGGTPSLEALQRMAAALSHRGPDADGFWPPLPSRNGNAHHPARPSALGFPIPHRPEGTRFRTPHSPAALAHRRLSIIDLSEAGRQPLSNEDGSVWISYNGEIYNFQELRAELEGLGHRFQTRTDTEV